jgi:hypothetical protein
MKKSRELVLQGAMEVMPRKLVQRTHLERKVSVVDQNIDDAKLAFCHLHQPFNILPSGHIGLKNNAASAARFHLIENSFGCGLVLMIIHHYRSAASRETNRCGRADASAGTGHQSDLSVQC